MTNGDWRASYSGGSSAHGVPDMVVRAYERTQFFEMRPALPKARSSFVHYHSGLRDE